VEDVVQRDDRAGDEMRAEEIDILLRSPIGVIAIDPEKPDRTIPTARQVAGVLAMGFDRALDARRPERGAKVVPR
jgi:hypothetical protein